jgi:hypothetical protein
MKNLVFVLLFMTSTFAQNLWQNEIQVQTAPNIPQINSFSNSKGIHIIYTYNGGVKYSLTQSNGILIKQDRIIENEGTGCSFANVVSNNTEVYAFYIKNNKINVAKSTDFGDTWNKNFSPYPLVNSNCNSLSAVLDYPNVHIVWSEKRNVLCNDAHYVRFTCSDNGYFNYYKCVSDIESAGGDLPSVTFSQDRINVCYINQLWFAKTRDMFKSDNNWQTSSQLVTDVMAGSMLRYQKVYSINNQLNAILKYDYIGGENPSYYFQHYVRSTNNVTWQFTGSNLYTNDNPIIISTITNNNRIHLIYWSNSENHYTHKYFENATWSNTVANMNFSAIYSLNSNYNDLYLVYYSGAKIYIRHYDDKPSAPQNLVLTNNGGHPRLTWPQNMDADVIQYKVYRNIGHAGWIFLTSTNLLNYDDPTITITTNPQTSALVEYKISAIDRSSSESLGYSNIVSCLTPGGEYKAKGQNQNVAISDYKLFQNYPNPFNPTSQISFSIPKSSLVQLRIYDVFGRDVQTLVDGFLSEGNHYYQFNGKNFASGVYFYTLKVGNYSATKKMILTK